MENLNDQIIKDILIKRIVLFERDPFISTGEG
jgi:hypothetical protein